jgi:hypothetical protein
MVVGDTRRSVLPNRAGLEQERQKYLVYLSRTVDYHG